MKLDRRSVLVGALGGVSLGAGAGLFAGRLSSPSKPEPPASEPVASEFVRSYAQQGEDLIVARMLEIMKATEMTYLDIGAHDPVRSNNTYLFYGAGYHGVLVEPNPYYVARIRERRPRDTVLEVGIGITEQAEADYYVVRGDGQLNTFSKEQVEELKKAARKDDVVEKVLKRRLVRINDVIAQHFPQKTPEYVSLDVEGLDFDILKSLDFTRYRPKVICVETAQFSGVPHEGIMTLMKENDYVLRGGTYVNSIFLDRRAIPT